MTVWQTQIWGVGCVVSGGAGLRSPGPWGRCLPPDFCRKATLTSPKQTSSTTTGIWLMGQSPSRTWAIAELLIPFSMGQRPLPSQHFYWVVFVRFCFNYYFFLPPLFPPPFEWKMQARACCIFPYAKENMWVFFSFSRCVEQSMVSTCCLKKWIFPFFPQFIKTERIILWYCIVMFDFCFLWF